MLLRFDLDDDKYGILVIMRPSRWCKMDLYYPIRYELFQRTADYCVLVIILDYNTGKLNKIDLYVQITCTPFLRYFYFKHREGIRFQFLSRTFKMVFESTYLKGSIFTQNFQRGIWKNLKCIFTNFSALFFYLICPKSSN